MGTEKMCSLCAFTAVAKSLCSYLEPKIETDVPVLIGTKVSDMALLLLEHLYSTHFCIHKPKVQCIQKEAADCA